MPPSATKTRLATWKYGLANLAPCTIDELATLARTRLKRMRYQPSLLDGFITETGLIPAPS